ncbi:hypothetical protein CCMSSC00406_0003871 [Pleurotus cornucopiae]|uniref:Uncharacterized protein n=1 Tax=Pleurotus cornucopiae TaxID=5321 RepID=A0ACB7IQL4_PLECO|nr:hypothetical protein CCMSSC00406_0003871 [Pleurotus cornucopiae]
MQLRTIFAIAVNISVLFVLATPVSQLLKDEHGGALAPRSTDAGGTRIGGGRTSISGNNTFGGAEGGDVSGNTSATNSNGVNSSNGNNVNIGNNGGNSGNSGNLGNGGNVGGVNSGNNGGINGPRFVESTA